ncbi:MAG TPA: GntR family transcriptional regulator [Pyrinomonadaceae bacterium]|nr:GntR family transcriptional regulator [Pyrinomonadaceae bacterium]
MRLWLSKNSEVPIREQLTTQIMLGVTSGDLKAGQRLPSTRELARRFRIHANTVSAAYGELERRGWLESRKGSGVYVREFSQGERELDAGFELDQLISAFLERARDGGYSLGEVQERVKRWLEFQPPDHFLVIDSDDELREILVAEIEEATRFRVRGMSADRCTREGLPAGAVAVALYGRESDDVRASLRADTNRMILLHSRSIPESLAASERPASDALVAVVSRWPEFLRWARTVLVAAGIDPAALNFRDAREEGWQRGLTSSAFVITDALTARRLPPNCTPRVFRMIADSSLDELRRFVKDFLTK